MIYRNLIYLLLLSICFSGTIMGQISIRIFANQKPSSAVFTAVNGKYELDIFDGKPIPLKVNEPVILASYDGRMAVKIRDSKSFMCDSLIVKGVAAVNSYTFRTNGNSQSRQFYNGDLKCLSDLGVLVFINICDMEQYVAGVVRTEGGPGKNVEYFKSQALLTRTFIFRHLGRHLIDGYNFCDNTHCQAFNGITTDSVVSRATRETRGLVILASDSTLVISAFHSNCGGETSNSEDVWLTGYPYLKKVIDPYCIRSLNAAWKKTVPLSDWITYLKRSGFVPDGNKPPSYNFSQITRQKDYRIGSFSLPFKQIRSDLNLRSSFFSVFDDGSHITLKGRGYGHGVGLCQEGAMVMASKGFSFNDIIRFYYSDIIITDIKYAKIVKNEF